MVVRAVQCLYSCTLNGLGIKNVKMWLQVFLIEHACIRRIRQ